MAAEEICLHNEPVALMGNNQAVQTGVFIWKEMDDECRLTLRYADQEITATEGDYFEAMCTIRRHIETQGLLPHCYGASRNAFPSSMSREMGQGLQVYRLNLGEPARTVDLVSIFANDPDMEPATVASQNAFYEDWLTSLRR